MREGHENHETQPAPEPSPLTLPPARLRERTADDMEFDITDPVHDLPLDDSERLEEDAEPLKD